MNTNRVIEINSLHETFREGLRTTIQTAIRIGELLSAQKKDCGHGNWTAWIKTNLKFSERTVQDYMRCYTKKELINEKSINFSTIREFFRYLNEPKAQQAADLPTKKPIWERVPGLDNIDYEKVRNIEVPPPIHREPKPPNVLDFITTLTRSLYHVLAPNSAHARKLEELLPHTYALPKMGAGLDELVSALRAIASTATEYADLLETRSPRRNHKIKSVNGQTFATNIKLLN